MSLIEDNREALQITRKGHETIIMISKHDYESMNASFGLKTLIYCAFVRLVAL
jgi:hypothetical protein